MQQKFKVGDKVCISKKFADELRKRGDGPRSWLSFFSYNYVGVVEEVCIDSVVIKCRFGDGVRVDIDRLDHYIDLKETPVPRRFAESGMKKVHVNKNVIIPPLKQPKLKVHVNQKSDR